MKAEARRESRRRPSSIGLRFALVLVAAVAATTAAVGLATYASVRRFALSEAERRLDLTALVEASRIRDAIVQKQRAIANWSRLEVMRALAYRDVDKQIADFLGRSLAGSPEDVAALCIDRSGEVVASAGDRLAAEASAGDRLPVEAGAAGASRAFDLFHQGGRALLRFSAAVELADAPAGGLGRVVLLVDPARLLATPSRVGAAAEASLTADGARLAARGAAGGGDSLAATAPVLLASDQEAPALAVVVRESAREILAPIDALRSRIVLAGLAVLAIASAVGAAVALQVTRPVRLLTEAVEDIRRRERLWGPIDLPSAPGELGVLADAFTRMARTLALAEERNAAQSRLALLGEIAANVAHEVRTPLTSMRSAGQMIAAGDRDADTQRRLAAVIVAEVDRLDRVVSDMVATARPAAGQRAPAAADALVDRARTTLEPLFAERGARIDVAEVARGLTVGVDADQIHQVLLNLLRNALDASPPAAAVHVSVGVDRAGDVVITVADEGPGFAVSVLARPFAPFHTTKRDGTGLGLAIVRRIVEDHGGRVSLGNREGGGAAVSVVLPRASRAGRAPRSDGNARVERPAAVGGERA